MELSPMVVEGSAKAELSSKNDEELFAVGSAAYAAGDFQRAAESFSRLCDLFPASKHRAAALFNAGLAYERLSEWRLAMERFRALEENYSGQDAKEASFRSAECLYHLRQLKEARTVLDGLASRKDFDTADQIRALTQRGIVELEDGDGQTAERSLRLAVSTYTEAKERERIDDYYPSQAQYYLGEVYRIWFEAIRLDPAQQDEEGLARDLEYKAEMLLSAQGHYLRTIRLGNPDWTIASGYRIGELYDSFYQELTQAPLPKGLDEEHAAAYRQQLSERVRILVTKAITVQEQTLAAAQRVGVTNAFVEKIQAFLERMKQILLGSSGSVLVE
jgi:hypothetical protein